MRALLDAAMFRQALAESQAWTPMESPWTLPTGLLGDLLPAARPWSRSTSWLAASEIASPTASGAKPSASAAATASAACAGVRAEDRLAHLVHPARRRPCGVPGVPAEQVVLVQQLRQQLARGRVPRRIAVRVSALTQ